MTFRAKPLEREGEQSGKKGFAPLELSVGSWGEISKDKPLMIRGWRLGKDNKEKGGGGEVLSTRYSRNPNVSRLENNLKIW
jgi:hypothetical protein